MQHQFILKQEYRVEPHINPDVLDLENDRKYDSTKYFTCDIITNDPQSKISKTIANGDPNKRANFHRHWLNRID